MPDGAVAVLVLLLALAAVYHEVLFLGRTLLPMGVGYGGVMGSAGAWAYPGVTRPDPYRWDRGASSWQVEPQARAIGAAYAAGSLPLWNPHQGLGAPLAGNAQSGAFDPLRLPVLISGHPLTWDAYYLLRTLGGLLLTLLYARSIGLGLAGRLAVALAYGFSGFLLIYNNNHFVEVYLLLPGLLWATEALAAGRQRAGLAGLALSVALSTLAGMPECTLLTFLHAAAYGAVRALALRGGWGARARLALLLALGWSAGVGLSAPMVAPLAEYIAHAHHIHAPEQNLGLAYEPLSAAAYLLVPFIQGPPGRHVLTGAPLGVKNYLGAAPLLLAIVGALALARRQPSPGPGSGGASPSRVAGLFALAAALLWAAKQFGVPLVNEVGRLPGLNLTLIKDWGGPPLALAVAVLCGFGVDAVARGRVGLASVLLGPTLVGLGLAAVAVGYADVLRQAGPLHLRATLGLAAGAALLAWAALLAARRWPGRTAGLACVIVVGLELLLLAPRGVYQDRHDPLAEPPFVRFLRERQAADPPFRLFAYGGLLHPNLATAFGLDDVRAMDALYPERYIRYVNALVTPVTDRFTGVPSGRTEGAVTVRGNRALSLAGVRYVVAPPGALPGEPAAPPQPDRLPLVYSSEVQVRENLDAFPRAFAVQSAVEVRGPDDAAGRLRQAAFDPTRQAVVEGTLPPEFPNGPRPPFNPAEARVVSRDGNRVEVAVEADGPRLLVLTDVYYPGWRARVDGVEAHVYPTNLAFRGVLVPGGAHRVVFSYEPESVARGLALAGLSALALAGGLVLLSLARHRPGASARLAYPPGGV